MSDWKEETTYSHNQYGKVWKDANEVWYAALKHTGITVGGFADKDAAQDFLLIILQDDKECADAVAASKKDLGDKVKKYNKDLWKVV